MLLVSSVIEKFVGYPETPRRLAHYQYPVCHSRSQFASLQAASSVDAAP